MKRTLILATSGLVLIGLGCKTSNSVNARVDSLGNAGDSLSYALGVSIGQNLKDQGINELNYAVVAQALEEQWGDKAMMTPGDADNYIRDQFNQIRQEKERAAKKEGLNFLEENQGKPGVKTSPTGLQYKILEEGDGPSPVATDEVTVHYEGRLIDGSVFDSSYERGQPATFPLSGVIPGWTEGLQYMNVGSKAELYIPADLGYGSRQAPGGKIPPYSTLIFTVELLEITGK
jgi:FKBP-type peptidyl-prolyl cis-trans isomerase FklB